MPHRPVPIDLDELEKLAAMHCTESEVAAWFSTNERSITQQAISKKLQRQPFKGVWERGWAKGGKQPGAPADSDTKHWDAYTDHDQAVGLYRGFIAAEETGRVCYAMEQAPQFIDVAVTRWEAFTGKKAAHG